MSQRWNFRRSGGVASVGTRSSTVSQDEACQKIGRLRYGDENREQVQMILSLTPQNPKEWPWNVRFRIWILQLKHKGARQEANQYTLSDILVSLRFESLNHVPAQHEEEDALDLMDLSQSDQQLGQSSRYPCWQEDSMLRFWCQDQRSKIVHDLKKFANNKILVSDQVCLIEILEIIDQMTGYNGSSFKPPGSASTDTEESNPIQQTTRATSSSAQLRKWLDSHLPPGDASEVDMDLSGLCEKLGNEGSRGSTFQALARAIEIEREEASFLGEKMGSIFFVDQGDDDTVIRGKALLAHLLLAGGIGTPDDFLRNREQNAAWTRDLVSTSETPDALFYAVDNFLLAGPRTNGVIPNLEVLTNHLCEGATQSPPIGIVVEVAKRFRQWLPPQSILSHFRAVLVESLSAKSRVLQQGHQNEHSSLQNMTALVVLVCDNGDNGRAEELDTILQETTLPLVFDHVLLVCSKMPNELEAPNGDRHAIAVISAIGRFISIVEVLMKESTIMSSLPKLVSMVCMMAGIDLAGSQNVPMQGNAARLQKNCKALQSLRGRIPLKRPQSLTAQILSTALIRFCLEQKRTGVTNFANVATKKWFDCSSEETISTWVCAIFQELQTQSRDAWMSELLEEMHVCVTERYAQQEPKRCWLQLLLAQLESFDSDTPGLKNNDRCVLNRILQMTPHQCFFAGSTEPLGLIFGNALNVLHDFQVASEGMKQLMIAVAVQIGSMKQKSGECAEKDAEWTSCAGQARGYLLRTIRSSRGSCVVSCCQDVSRKLQAIIADTGLEWWKDVSSDLVICSTRQNNTLTTCSNGRRPSQALEIHFPQTRKRAASHALAPGSPVHALESKNEIAMNVAPIHLLQRRQNTDQMISPRRRRAPPSRAPAPGSPVHVLAGKNETATSVAPIHLLQRRQSTDQMISPPRRQTRARQWWKPKDA